MEYGFKNGAMYVRLSEEEEKKIENVPIKLGDGILYPGEFVQKLGDKERANFEMKPGNYLRYIGKLSKDKLIIFGVNLSDMRDRTYYAFHYITRNCLFVSGNGFGYDIRVFQLKKENPVFLETEYEQLELELF
jgi:hypothetical protein